VDIARKLGISVMTVSRALNGKAEVREELRQKIVECAESLGYQPNRWARSLVTKKSLMIGVVIPEIAHSFFAEMISGIEETLESAGYDLLLCHSRGDADREKTEIQALLGSRIDGFIVAPVQPENKPELFLDLQKRKTPFVLVDRFFPRQAFPSVRVDDAKAGYLATDFLIKLGHRSIGHIAGPSLSPGSLRRRGYLKALHEHGLDGTAKQCIVRAAFDIDAGRHAMEKLLQLRPRPTAVFAANDPQAIGAVYACRDAGLRVPEDISIVGAGNIEGVFHPHPFLTTIDWPRVDLGRVAAEILLKIISGRGREAPESHVFEPELLIRHSTARLS
jgi:LacI family transcriptional regulator